MFNHQDIMTTLSSYIDNLLATISSIGSRAFGNSTSLISDTTRTPFRVQSVEFTVPVAIHGTAPFRHRNHMQAVETWLGNHTWEELTHLLRLAHIPQQVLLRLKRTIQEKSLKVQALLEQEEISIHQVFLDHAQTVLALVWDECQQHSPEGQALEAGASVGNENSCFEELTEQLASKLRYQYMNHSEGSQPETIHVTIESQKIREAPAHALTYIKLLITGDSSELQCLDFSPH